jgi:hypothetical protein
MKRSLLDRLGKLKGVLPIGLDVLMSDGGKPGNVRELDRHASLPHILQCTAQVEGNWLREIQEGADVGSYIQRFIPVDVTYSIPSTRMTRLFPRSQVEEPHPELLPHYIDKMPLHSTPDRLPRTA